MANLSPAVMAKYDWRGRAFAEKLKASKPFELDAGGEVVLRYDQDTYDRLVSAKTAADFAGIKFFDLKGKSYAWTAFRKDADLGGGGSAAGANLGDIAEGVLSYALGAKFWTLRETLTVGDIKSFIKVHDGVKVVKDGGKEKAFVDFTVTNSMKDKVRVRSVLPKAALDHLHNESNWGKFGAIFTSACAYANSKNVQRYMRYFMTNGVEDFIYVNGDGVGGQRTGAKADVILYFSNKFNKDMKQTRLEISLKNGAVKQVGQIAGAGHDKLVEFFGHFGVSVKDHEGEFGEQDAEAVYKDAAAQFRKMLAGHNAKKEFEAFVKIAQGIRFFAAGHSPGVELVHFDKSTFHVLKFSGLAEKIFNKVDLDAEFNASRSRPEIVIFDKESGKTLVTLRRKFETLGSGKGYARNYVEIGPMLKELTKVAV